MRYLKTNNATNLLYIRLNLQAELLSQIDAFIEGKGDFPDEANVSSQTHPGHPDCPFFSKTGACRFRDSCSRWFLPVYLVCSWLLA